MPVHVHAPSLPGGHYTTSFPSPFKTSHSLTTTTKVSSHPQLVLPIGNPLATYSTRYFEVNLGIIHDWVSTLMVAIYMCAHLHVHTVGKRHTGCTTILIASGHYCIPAVGKLHDCTWWYRQTLPSISLPRCWNAPLSSFLPLEFRNAHYEWNHT